MAGDDSSGGPDDADESVEVTDDADESAEVTDDTDESAEVTDDTDESAEVTDDTDESAEVTDDPSAASGSLDSVVFLLALLVFLGSALAYVLVLATGGDVLIALAANAAAALALVTWTAHDTYSDPDSDVTSLPGALGTALLMLGVYGLVASVVVAATSLWHDRFQVAIWLGAGAALAAVLGFFTFPAEVLAPADEEGQTGTEDPD